jgi:hypothetical protein
VYPVPVTVNDYIAKRARLLTDLVLTRRKDLRILTLADAFDVGIDCVVQVLTPVASEFVYPSFGVQVKGTSQHLPDEDAATEHARKGWKPLTARKLFLGPILVFLFSVEDDVGYYSWLMQPQVLKDAPGLSDISTPVMHRLTREAVDDIVAQVTSWFEVMSPLLFKHLPGRN